MKPETLKNLLKQLQDGKVGVDEAFAALESLPFKDLGHTVVDHHRAIRKGFPEVLFGENKTVDQIVAISKELAVTGQHVLVTRVSAEKAALVCARVPGMGYKEVPRCLVLQQGETPRRGAGTIAIVTAGTSDIPVAAEAALVAEMAGNDVMLINDVGVAGVHRLLHRLDDLRNASVLVVVAGMEGALPSVVGGLVSAPVIAVPTSVGYGVSFNGVTALLGMLSSCSSGVTVVNIDNGFGAGYAASLMNRIGEKQ